MDKMEIKTLITALGFGVLLSSCTNVGGGSNTPPNDPSDPVVAAQDTMPTSRVFYEGMLDYFCNLYYAEAFNWSYDDNSLVIENLHVKDAETMEIEGIHSYRKGLITRGKKSFKATVVMTGTDEYEITFEKKERKPLTTERYWVNTIKTITYSDK